MTRVIRSLAEMREWSAAAKRNRVTVGFVPTMGALHDGHRSLMRRSWPENDRTVVSVYVNPLQFLPGEDFEKYPRTFERDLAACEAEKVDVVWAPETAEIRPAGLTTRIVVGGVSESFEGARRPGHFDGVATIVATLFHVVQPDRAYFGRKDFQQSVVVRRMVRDLAMPVDVVVCPIVREPDGLAMSSRNVYLSPELRAEALRLPRALDAAVQAFAAGERDAARLRALMTDLMTSPRADVGPDYAEPVHPETLAPLATVETGSALLAVLRCGPVRLLDNRVLGTEG